jgi:predicted PurR-regulated permease PerM
MPITGPTRIHYAVLTLAGVVVVLAGARYAQSIVVPFLLSLFIATIAATPVGWLKRHGMALPLAVSLVILLLVFGLLALGMLLGATIDQFASALPDYQDRLQALNERFVVVLQNSGLDVPKGGLLAILDLRVVMKYANTLVAGFGVVLSNAVIIMFTVFFMLLEAWSFPAKVAEIQGERAIATLARFVAVMNSTKHYTAAKTLTSFSTGVLIWIGLELVGVDFAALWGFIAFLFNYVPNIGSIIAAIPAVLLTLLQLGPAATLIVISIYLFVNILIGNLIEPRMMGRWMGLSTLVVFLSLLFWGWLLGPVGMLLSVPLTMVVKFAAEVNEETRWIGVMLGPPPLEEESSA